MTKWALAIGLVVLLAVVGELWRIHSQNAITYETVPLERGSVQASVTATGTLNAVVDVQVGSQVSGNIKALYADFNTKVTKGQLVALIDPEVFQTQVDQAQAAFSSAQSAVLTAGAQVQKATSDLSGTLASEKSAEAVIAKDRATALNATNPPREWCGCGTTPTSTCLSGWLGETRLSLGRSSSSEECSFSVGG